MQIQGIIVCIIRLVTSNIFRSFSCSIPGQFSIYHADTMSQKANLTLPLVNTRPLTFLCVFTRDSLQLTSMTNILHTNTGDRERFISDAIAAAVQPLIDHLVEERTAHLEEELRLERQASAAAVQQLLVCQNNIENNEVTIANLNIQVSALRQDIVERDARYCAVFDLYTGLKNRLEAFVSSIPDVQPPLVEDASIHVSSNFPGSPTLGSESAPNTTTSLMEPDNPSSGLETPSSCSPTALPPMLAIPEPISFASFLEVENRHARPSQLDNMAYFVARRALQHMASGILKFRSKKNNVQTHLKNRQVVGLSLLDLSLEGDELVFCNNIVCPMGSASYQTFLKTHISDNGVHFSQSLTRHRMAEVGDPLHSNLVDELVEQCACSPGDILASEDTIDKSAVKPSLLANAPSFEDVWGVGLPFSIPEVRCKTLIPGTNAPCPLVLVFTSGKIIVITSMDDVTVQTAYSGPSTFKIKKNEFFEIVVQIKLKGLSVTRGLGFLA
ncbi:hypothetical protein DL96DRAFT_668637 [Flagelloscypha sp. PMI_526]|nr:hypothetical protein DL96DRAFT_668637 [Flagelloscypha sp. PMI_526]